MAQTQTERAIYLPEPHAGQQAVLQAFRSYRFIWLDAGRRWRKTSLGLHPMVESVLTTGQEYVWAAPSYKQARIGWMEMKRAASEVCDFNESRMEVRFPNGGLIHYLSLENYDKDRGYTSFGTVIDEGSECPGAAYYEVVRHFLTGTDGWQLVMATPKGRNWFFTEWLAASHGERAGHVAFQIPSFGCAIDAENGRLIRQPHPLENPHLTMAEMEELYEQLGERRFRQEILAEFLDDAGGVFRGVRACIRGGIEAGPTHPTTQYVIGVDLAKYQDYTVCVVIDVARRQVVAFERFNKADWTLQKARIANLAKHWNNAELWVDSTGVGDPICDDLRAGGLRVNTYTLTSASKNALINNLVLMVEQQQIGYPEIVALVNELLAYEYERTPAGVLRMNAPEGQHDDCVIAFALACWPLAHTSSLPFTADIWQQLEGRATEIGGVKLLRRRI